MARNVAEKLIADHLVDGEMVSGREIGVRVDQTLTQDATGTMVMLELEASHPLQRHHGTGPRRWSTVCWTRFCQVITGDQGGDESGRRVVFGAARPRE